MEKMNKSKFEDQKALEIRELKIMKGNVEAKLESTFRDLESIEEGSSKEEIFFETIAELEEELEELEHDIKYMVEVTYEEFIDTFDEED